MFTISELVASLREQVTPRRTGDNELREPLTHGFGCGLVVTSLRAALSIERQAGLRPRPRPTGTACRLMVGG